MPVFKYDALDLVPCDFDWGDNADGEPWSVPIPNPEDWDEDEQKQFLDDWGFGAEVTDPVETIYEALQESLEPMMNYYYPLPSQENRDPAELQKDLLDVCGCVIVVELHGDPVLALSGGGMDLTWDIVGAYHALGYFPPVHYARDLPKFAGMGFDDAWTREVFAACYGAVQAAKERMTWGISSVEQTWAWMLDHTTDLPTTLDAIRERLPELIERGTPMINVKEPKYLFDYVGDGVCWHVHQEMSWVFATKDDTSPILLGLLKPTP